MSIDGVKLSESWQKRFVYFDRYGPASSTPEGKAAYKALPFMEKVRLTSNIWAFLFGPIYFAVKGMWRKGVVLLVAAILLNVPIVVFDVPTIIANAIMIVVPVFAMTTANYAYYLHATQGNRSWNVLEGMKAR